ncbi:hypothetical protein HEK131_38440 [Streptomyces seoulensis]|nr:hypothetical protein HEK131_38440 [Streptomyces seoulensis]
MAGSTPAITENEIASGISARATTRPPSTSVRSTLGSDSQDGRRKRRGRAGAEGTDVVKERYLSGSGAPGTAPGHKGSSLPRRACRTPSGEPADPL